MLSQTSTDSTDRIVVEPEKVGILLPSEVLNSNTFKCQKYLLNFVSLFTYLIVFRKVSRKKHLLKMKICLENSKNSLQSIFVKVSILLI